MPIERLCPSPATPVILPSGPVAALSPAAAAPRASPAIDSALLLQGNRVIPISHNGELYRLQATRQGKLILTK